MFDWLEAEAYHKLRFEIMYLIVMHSKECKERDSYQKGKLDAFSEVLDRINAIDVKLQEKINREVEKDERRYIYELSHDNYSHEQQ